jgi:hypothetical protein
MEPAARIDETAAAVREVKMDWDQKKTCSDKGIHFSQSDRPL